MADLWVCFVADEVLLATAGSLVEPVVALTCLGACCEEVTGPDSGLCSEVIPRGTDEAGCQVGWSGGDVGAKEKRCKGCAKDVQRESRERV